MIELITGSLITLIALLIGFSLGRHEKPIPPKVAEHLQEIFKKKISPQSSVGAVLTPTQEQLDRYKNPKLAEEEKIMEEELDRLNKKG